MLDYSTLEKYTDKLDNIFCDLKNGVIMTKKDLIILGNGFDINAGLPTTYNEYFEYEKENGYFNRKTLWHTIFSILVNGDGVNAWYDIESEMLDFLKNYQFATFYLLAISSLDSYQSGLGRSSPIDINLIEKIYRKTEKRYNPRHKENITMTFNNVNAVMWELIEVQQNLGMKPDCAKLFAIVRILSEMETEINGSDVFGLRTVRKMSLNSVVEKLRIEMTSYVPGDMSVFNTMKKNPFLMEDKLKKELSAFEKDFSKYVDRVREDSNVYAQNSVAMLRILSQKPQLNNSTNVLSFNYTNPRDYYIGVKKYVDELRNLHGKTGKNTSIIFGIDNNNLFENVQVDTMMSNHLLPYTKTFRTLELIDEDDDNWIEDVNCIKIFGHSMSAADYSYYQSIFDATNLYGTEVKLWIYYYDYSNDGINKLDSTVTTQSIKSGVFQKISALLNKYGNETIQNKKQGQNLMHKLQLENRLKIKEMTKIELIESGFKFSN